MIATIAALALAHIHQYEPLMGAFDKQASNEGFKVLEEAPRFHLGDPAGHGQLLARCAVKGIFRIEVVVAQVSDDTTRRDLIRSLRVTQAAQFGRSAPALKGSAINLFSFGSPPAITLDGAQWASSVSAYGLAGQCVVQGTLRKTVDDKPDPTSKRQAIDALTRITAAVGKIAKTVE